jgi:predicted ATP-dependent serine protease
MQRTRKPRINLVGFSNDYVVIEATEKPNKWLGKCKSCNGIHEQTGREIQRNQAPMSCEHYKLVRA